MSYEFDDSTGFFKRTIVLPFKRAKNGLKRTFFKHFPWPKSRKGLLKSLKFIINQTEEEDKDLIAKQLKHCAELSRKPEKQRDENPAFLRQRIAFNIYRSSTGSIYTQPEYPSLMDGQDILNRRFMGVISGGIKSFLNSSPKEQQKFLTAITPPKKQSVIPFTRTQQKD